MGAAFPKKPGDAANTPTSPAAATGPPGANNPGDDMLKFRLPQPDESKDVMVKRLAILTGQYPSMSPEYVNTAFSNLILKQNFIKKKPNLILIVTAVVAILLIGIAIVYYTMQGRSRRREMQAYLAEQMKDREEEGDSERPSSEKPDERGPPPSKRSHQLKQEKKKQTRREEAPSTPDGIDDYS